MSDLLETLLDSLRLIRSVYSLAIFPYASLFDECPISPTSQYVITTHIVIQCRNSYVENGNNGNFYTEIASPLVHQDSPKLRNKGITRAVLLERARLGSPHEVKGLF